MRRGAIRSDLNTTDGHPVPPYIDTALTALLTTGHLQRGPTPTAPLEITPSGTTLFTELDSPGGLT